jgi:SulP family sulfate permease
MSELPSNARPEGGSPSDSLSASAAATSEPKAAWILRRVPALDSLRTYSRAALVRDLTAGLTVATIAIPQAMAYATLAGLPPQYGLYTAIIMTAVGALLDSSRQLINGPTNAISIALLSALAIVPEADRISMAIALAFLVGAVQLGIAFLRLGDLTRFVSHSVIVGFTIGASLLLVLDQTKHLLGQPARGEASDHFLKRFWLSLVDGSVHATTVLVGVGTIVVVIAIRQLNTFLRRRGARFPIPQHLVAVALAATAVWAFGLDHHGVKIVGSIPAELPGLHFPELKWEQVQLVAGSAFAIALLGLLEAVAMAKAIAAQTGQRLDVNQQCLSEGAANLVGSFFQCMPGSGSLTRSAVNQQAGAVSQWSGVFAAATVAGTVLLLAPLAYYIPRASLAGLLILAAYRMVDVHQLLFHLRATRLDAGVIVATALAAVLISIEFCILIGVFLSFVLYVPRAAHVRLTSLTPIPDDLRRAAQAALPSNKQFIAYELEGEVFFGAEAEIAKHFRRIENALSGEVGGVILRLHRARNPDAAFLALLAAFHQRLAEKNATLVLCNIQHDLLAALKRTDLEVRICQLPGDGQ